MSMRCYWVDWVCLKKHGLITQCLEWPYLLEFSYLLAWFACLLLESTEIRNIMKSRVGDMKNLCLKIKKCFLIAAPTLSVKICGHTNKLSFYLCFTASPTTAAQMSLSNPTMLRTHSLSNADGPYDPYSDTRFRNSSMSLDEKSRTMSRSGSFRDGFEEGQCSMWQWKWAEDGILT